MPRFISQLSTGLSVPAGVKDCITPLVLFLNGGYYFDLDCKAVKTLIAEQSPYGFKFLQGSLNMGMSKFNEIGLEVCKLFENFFKYKFEPYSTANQASRSFLDIQTIKNRSIDLKTWKGYRAYLLEESTGQLLINGIEKLCSYRVA